MAGDSPAAILFDINGNPIGVVQTDESAYRLQTTTRITDGYSYVGITDVLGEKALKVDVIKTVGSGSVGIGGTSSNYDIQFPDAGTAVGFSDGYYMRSAHVYDLDTSGTSEYVLGVNLRTFSSGNSIEIGNISNPIRIDPTGTTIQPISVSSLPLPSGAATEVTLATLLTSSTFTGRINTLGQKTMANSTPVTIASDQSTLTVDGYVTVDIRNTNGLALDATVNSLLKEATFTSRINTLGQKTMSASTPVVIASDQGAISVNVLSTGTTVEKTLYDIGNTDIYIGTAAQGTLTSAASWLIKRVALDVNGNPTSTLWSSNTAIWDNRLTETYS